MPVEDIMLIVAAMALLGRLVALLVATWWPLPACESSEDKLKRWYVENDVSIEDLEREVEREWQNGRY